MEQYHLEHLVRALIYIEEHLDEPLTLEQLSRIACISPYHFHRLFHAFVGESVAAYVRRLRMEKAAGKLLYTEQPVTDIGFDAGYETSAAFAKAFRQLMGFSPQKYRKSLAPAVRSMLQNTKETTMLKPTFVERAEEEVLFVRRVGNYRETPKQAFAALVEYVEANHLGDQVKALYGMGLDNPEVTEKENLRFDACAAVNAKPSGEVGKKTLKGGRYAIFVHEGPYEGLERIFLDILSKWYPTSGETLADAPCFCEYLNWRDRSVSPEERCTKCYIPLKSDR